MNLTATLSQIFVGPERLTDDEIRRRASAAGVDTELATALDALPEGEYAEDEVVEALGQIDQLRPDLQPPADTTEPPD
jgi:hypothetical protein